MNLHHRASYVAGTGAFLPGAPITNEQLAGVFGRRIHPMCRAIGVHQRHFAIDPNRGWTPTDMSTSRMAVQAASAALASARLEAGRVDAIVMVTATPDYPFPATAPLVQEALGIKECIALEIRGACAGSIQALVVADLLIRSGQASNAIVVGSELSSCFVRDALVRGEKPNLSDDMLLAAAMFADGAGALVLRALEAGHSAGRGLFGSVLNSVGMGRPPGFWCRVGGSVEPPQVGVAPQSPIVTHDFREILKSGPELVLRAFADLSAKTAMQLSDFSVVIPPQANPRLTWAVLAARGLPREKVFFNVHEVGNTSAASLFVALDAFNRAGRAKTGDSIALLGAEASKWLYGGVALQWV